MTPNDKKSLETIRAALAVRFGRVPGTSLIASLAIAGLERDVGNGIFPTLPDLD